MNQLKELIKVKKNRLGIKDRGLVSFKKRCLEAIWDPNSQEVIVEAWNGNYNIALQFEKLSNNGMQYRNSLELSNIIRRQIVSILVEHQIHESEELTGLDENLTAELNGFLAEPANRVHLNFLQLTVYHVIEYAVYNNNEFLERVQNDYKKLVAKIIEDQARKERKYEFYSVL